ncbi:MAG: hypothetical protein J6X02_02820 [Bacilli bacterium]|nr:hypothetical protein [Bacilli bacterium]
MKVLFLDIDGVLNNQRTFVNRKKEYYKTGQYALEIDVEKVLLLKEIIDTTEAVIVLSSSWRSYLTKIDKQIIPVHPKMRELVNLFYQYGLFIYDITPYDEERYRQKEIQEWLNNHDNIESFAILDDDDYDLPNFIDKELVKTKFTDKMVLFPWIDHGGLQKEHVEKAVAILNKKDQKIVKKR